LLSEKPNNTSLETLGILVSILKLLQNEEMTTFEVFEENN